MRVPVEFASHLSPVQWAVLAGIPVGIIALYFLKLRRRPVQVPSTLLWRRSLEDLHVNSLFQRLRRNLLLFLQLLIIALAALALAGPRVHGRASQGQRYVLLIDNSASMSADDGSGTRLAQAKEEARKVIRSMEDEDLAMVIAFADRAWVVASYTRNRRLLEARVDSIRPSSATTSLRDALQVAAGLANPSRQIGEGVVATSVVTPKLMIFTDGGFPDVEGFSLGNLEPHIVVIGPPPPAPSGGEPAPEQAGAHRRNASDNVAVLALQTRRNEEKTDQFQVFGRVHNYRGRAVTTEAKLLKLDPAQRGGGAGTLIDALELTIPAQSDQSFKFDLPDTGAAELEVRLDAHDALELDNHAYTLVGRPRRAQVLVVSPGNRYLIDTLRTPYTQQTVDFTEATPKEADADPLAREIKAGRFDLVIYDQVRPKEPPEANALYFGVLPPGPAYEHARTLERPIILDWDFAHPMMQYIRDLPTVFVQKAVTVELPPGTTELIKSNQGTLAFLAPRAGFSDAVIGFGLLNGKTFNTNWPLRVSFPLFLANSLRFLGNARESAGEEVHLPGQPVILRAESTVKEMRVIHPRDPAGDETLARSPQGTFVANRTDATGLYHAHWGTQGASSFAVNLFDDRESDLSTRGLAPAGVSESQAEAYKIKIGYTPVTGVRRTAPERQEWWKPIAVAALVIVLIEWYIYNRKVYI